MFPMRQYLLQEHALGKARQKLERALNHLADRVHKIRIRTDRGCQPISTERLAEWICASSASSICAALGVDEVSEPALVKEVSAIQECAKHLQGVEEYRAIDALRALQVTPITRAAQIKALLGNFGHKDLPIDAFFVCSVPAESHLGFVIDFRSLNFVSAESLFTSASASRGEEVVFLRIARLGSTFRHALAQQFGYLFSRIGFQKEYERERDATFSLVIEELIEEKS